jgi:hypothetical protein
MLAIVFLVLLAFAAPLSAGVLPGPGDDAASCSSDGIWLPPVTGSPARDGQSMILDTRHDRFVLFGGLASFPTLPASNETWTCPADFSAPWRLLTTAGPLPGPRAYHSAIYDPVLDRMIVYGGSSLGAVYADASELSFASDPPVWKLINPFSNSPAKRNRQMAVYDGIRRRMLVFGGDSRGPVFDGVTNETYELTLDGAPVWTRLFPSPQVSRRYMHCAAYDSKRDRWIVAGGMGYGLTNPQLLDVEAIDLTTLLVERLPDLPGASLEGTLTYDPKEDRLLLFGGDGSSADVSELRLGEGGGWRALAAGGESVTPGRRSLSACLDAARNRLVFAGGERGSYSTVTDVIAFGRDADAGLDPGRFSAPISPRSTRPVSFVLRGTAGLAVREVDPATIRVGDGQVDTRRGGALLGDVDGDGLDDLSFEVVAASIGVGPEATSAPFSAKTLVGEPVCGTASLDGGGGIDPMHSAQGRIHLVSEASRVMVELRDVRGRIVARTEVPGPVDGWVDPTGGRNLPVGVYWARVVGSPGKAVKVVRLR